METSTHLIANKESLRTKKGKIDEIHLALENVIRARGQCYLMMNVKRSSLDAVKRYSRGSKVHGNGCCIKRKPRRGARSRE